ncbi:NUDIX domain-containing protein [Phellopilus nigrolimitatus]|nr:NUDIX domain-containing protein [Phellopilus nigrolimitatus]
MSTTSKTKPASESAPRPSASLIVVNALNEVLMVQRNLDSRSFAGAHVFPGGNFDKAQDSSLEMTALRETFEETGILLASRASQSKLSELTDAALEKARAAIHAGKFTFTSFLTENGLEPDVSSLLPRFRARFFITFLPLASALAGPSSGSHLSRLPSPDMPDASASSATEVISAQFINPRAVLSAFERGEVGLMPPQFYLLTTLRDIFSGPNAGADEDTSTPVQRQQVMQLARGAFGRMVINPRLLLGPSGELPDGRKVLTYEGDETRGGKKGRLHRVVLKPRKGTPIPSQMEIIRNFNIFTEMEETLSVTSSKL